MGQPVQNKTLVAHYNELNSHVEEGFQSGFVTNNKIVVVDGDDIIMRQNNIPIYKVNKKEITFTIGDDLSAAIAKTYTDVIRELTHEDWIVQATKGISQRCIIVNLTKVGAKLPEFIKVEGNKV